MENLTPDAMDDGLQDLGVPVPVQTFLWRQIAPFIRPKLGKLHEASCMELKEACKSFEKVLVQNIQFGLSPSLTSALQAIPRWRLVQAALPHVMHCAAALLHNRVKDLQSLGAAETKLLYTLHWILLYAGEECADSDAEQDKQSLKSHQYLFSVPTISLFVYLFAPVAHHLKESDFQNFRLENGIRLWQGMWEYRAPNAPCFIAPVKPRARQLYTPTSPKSTMSPDEYPIRKQSGAEATPLSLDSPQSLSYSTELPKHDDDWISSPKDCAFPETIPEEASSVEEERVVIFRLPSSGQNLLESFYTADASLLQQSNRGSKQSLLSQDRQDRVPNRFDFDKIEVCERGHDRRDFQGSSKICSPIDKDSIDEGSKSPHIVKYDVTAATFLDVAVMRCLFISHWQEEGVYWSLHYFNNRLRDISEEASVPIPQPRKRSNSLPIPQIEISLYQGPNSRDSPSGSSAGKDYIEIPEPSTTAHLTDDSSSGRRGSEKKRRVKMADIARAFVETKMFSKSDRALEKDLHRSLDTGEAHLSRSVSMIHRAPSTNLVKGKSMPSLRYVEPQKVVKPTPPPPPPARAAVFARNPIITVTEHTPTPSPDYLRRQGSIDSQLDALSSTGSAFGFRSQMLRSHTDSHIAYAGPDETEAPGSSFYITPEGGIDYEILLLAVYTIFKKDSNICSLRVLEAGLNISELLLDLGILKMGQHAHKLSMGILKRALLHLGCPHGCNEGIRGPPAEFLRTQCHTILSRMLRQVPAQSRNYLRNMVRTTQLHELIEFFHAFVGFCVDPSSLLSPLSNIQLVSSCMRVDVSHLSYSDHKRTPAFKTMTPDIGGLSGGQGGYATNFGGGLSGGAESQVIAAVFKALVTRFVESFKDLKSQENIALYCDVRQLVTYVKGAHGGPFRRVALSGIMAVTPRPHKKGPNYQTTRVIRHIPHTDTQSYQQDERAQRKLLFKKRSTSSTCASLLETSETYEEPFRHSQSPLSNLRRKTASVRPTLTPRHSERALLSDSTSSSERNSGGKLGGIVRWFRGSKDRCSIDLETGTLAPDIMASFARQSSFKLQGRRSGEGLGRSLQRARRRVERRLGRFGIGKGKKKVGGTEEAPGSWPRESEVVVLKERRLVPILAVREGMCRFSFLLETCAPGSVPDAQLVAATLDLPQAPLVTRAAFLLECAHFVHLCNRGQWPSWMKQNQPFRPSGPNLGSRSALASSTRRIHVLQRAAGKMFYQWAELLGARLEEMLKNEKQTYDQVTASMCESEKQRQLLLQDEEEDFLDEACVNPHGNDCPPALKLVACVLLNEITAFLRETYQTLPKTSKLSTKEKPAPWEKVYREANRRWSMALSSMGHSQTSAQSLQSIAGGDGVQPERKISFVLHEPDNESEGSSNTTVTLQGEEPSIQPQRRPVAAVRPFLLRRGTAGAPTGGSFKRRSLKLRRGTKDGKDLESDYPVKRTDSIQSRRKVSSLSDRSDTSEQGVASGGEESPGILSDDQPPESPSDSNDTDETGKTMPWMKAALELVNSFNFYCSHQNFCHPFCYRRHMRASSRLVKAVRKELLGLDVLHKFMWVRLIARMFEAMAGNFAYSADIQLFLNVLSGAAILHSEDSCIMRYVTATFINAAFNFKNIFSTNGYFMIMPTLLQVYSLHQTNKLVTTTIEYAVKQFYLLNRKPFILQMFGSVSAILDTDEDGMYGEAHKVQSSCLFNLLLSLETPSPDPLNIAELVKEPKPLKAIDFCYHDEDEMVTVLDCITLCVMVVSYSAESTRGYQMLIILEAILPCYMQKIQSPSYIPLEGKSERDIILQLAIAIRTMVHNCEGLSKSYNGPFRNSPEHKGSSQRNCSRGPPCSPGLDFEDESHSKYVSDVGRMKIMDTAEDSELVRAEYRRPRDVLLSVVGEFISRATTRLQELSKKQGADTKPVELLDVKCHVRLADIAHSLLKVSPYDPESMACRGLQRYMACVLPRAEWADDAMRPALVTILRRLDKVFMKISKKPSIRRNTDWEAASGLLKGIHETVIRYPYVLHWQHVKVLLSTVQNLIVHEPGQSPEGVSSAGAAVMSQNPPPFFCSTAVRLITLQVVSPVDCFTLEHICGGSAEFPTQEKAEGHLIHLIMPLCLKACSGKDLGELRQHDISFLVTAILNAMSPPAGRTAQGTTQSNRVVGDLRAGSLTFTGSREAKRPARISGSLYQAAFLALRILCISFEQRLATEWPRIVRIMRDLGRRNEAARTLEFPGIVVNHRTPLYIVLMPFILHKISQPPIGDHERHMQFLIRERMRGMPQPGGVKSRGALLLELARELKDLREELEERRYGSDRDIPEPSRRDVVPSTLPPVQEVPKHAQRPSLISLLTGAGPHIASQMATHHERTATPSDSASQHTLHPPRESLSSGSTTNREAVPIEDSSGEIQRHRLQRSKAQSRKTFRIKRGQPGRQTQAGDGATLAPEPVEPPPPPQPKTVSDLSWDSVSQTSSTSGYRDNCSFQTGLLSPDGSLASAPPIGRSSSQHSLLMLFEAQDEDTLI
uniref:Uncharacterized protein n=2 Tax=Lutzomyia longipalpis TaxID=7200 RepID=A0A1B0CSU9_LUTLO